jgi:hypothetical protein
MNEKEDNENYLKELFGDIESFLKFYEQIPTEEKIINKGKNEALDRQGMVCWYCLNRKIFTGCKNFVKRTVDLCHGAFGEEVIKKMRAVSSLTDDEKRKIEHVLNEIATKEVAK